MKYRDLREFIQALEARGELKRIAVEIDPRLEMTEICDRVLQAQGPALLFEKPRGHSMPVLGNLFGTPLRVAFGMGQERVESLREVGQLLASIKEPAPPRSFKDAWDKLPDLTVELKTVPAASYFSVVRSGPEAGGWTLASTSWIGDFSDPLAFLQMWAADSNLNDASLADPEYDRLLASAAAKSPRR